MAVYSNIYGEITNHYEGCVLKVWEHNMYDDSDFLALVWNDEEQKVEQIMYDTTRCGGSGRAEVDVTLETAIKVYKYYKNLTLLNVPAMIRSQRNKVDKGREVEVIKGRKVKKGTSGKVFWIGDVYNQYNYSYETRVGFITQQNEKVFVPISYVKTIDGHKVKLSSKERKKAISSLAFSKCPGWVQYVLEKRVSQVKIK